jgi:hypothetical protein
VRRAPAFLALGLCLAAGCGYGLGTRWMGKGGADRVEVRPVENLSTQPGLGATVTEALRIALARRGAASGTQPGAGRGEGARIEGDVRAREPAPSSPGARTWRIAVEVRARLLVGEKVAAEGTFSREADYLAGADPVESEGRRALAMRRLAGELADEILAAFER